MVSLCWWCGEKEEVEEIRSLTFNNRNSISVCDNNSMKSFNTKNTYNFNWCTQTFHHWYVHISLYFNNNNTHLCNCLYRYRFKSCKCDIWLNKNNTLSINCIISDKSARTKIQIFIESPESFSCRHTNTKYNYTDTHGQIDR